MAILRDYRKPHPLSSRKEVVENFADCLTCGKRWAEYKTTRSRALAHATYCGHTVVGVHSIRYIYEPKEQNYETVPSLPTPALGDLRL